MKRSLIRLVVVLVILIAASADRTAISQMSSRGRLSRAPTLSAGSNRTVTLAEPLTVVGAASDDGLPDGSTLTTTWSLASGPGTARFADAHALSTAVTFSAVGSYVLRLMASNAAVSSFSEVGITVVPPSQPLTQGLRVVGNGLIDANGRAVRLLGVNRPGTEYACVQGWGVFDGPADAASVQAMKTWNINTVRIPLNEDCWLDINGVNPAYSGAIYRAAIVNNVNLLHQFGLYAVLDLHWSAPAASLSRGQQVMADLDHSLAFWMSVATTFKSDPGVMYDLYNEPHDITYACWRDGCTTSGRWRAAGMQSLVDAVRSTGATQPIMLTAPTYGDDLNYWLAYKPTDPLNSLIASLHKYNFSACITSSGIWRKDDFSCWDSMIKPVAAVVPVVAGELGEDDCAHQFIDSAMNWMDAAGVGYLGWGWYTGNCRTAIALITNYSGAPTAYGIGLRDHLVGQSLPDAR